MTLPPITRGDLAMQASAAAQVIINRVSDARIQGLGGGRFPTAVKLARAKNATTLIANGLQSEPDNNSDMALLEQHTENVISGIALAALATGATDIALVLPAGLSKDLRHATQTALQSELDWLKGFCATDINARQIYLASDHASGEEHQLAYRLGLIQQANRSDHERPLIQLGLACLNLATCYAICRAVFYSEYLDRRMVTVNGHAQWLQFGTPVQDLVNPAWINGRHGGDANTDQRIDAGVFCVTSPPPPPTAPCINCGACAPVCPVSLAPDELYRVLEDGTEARPTAGPGSAAAKAGAAAKARALNLADCIECGACNAVCPSKLQLTQEFRQAKLFEKEAATRDALALKAKARVDARNERLNAQETRRQDRLRSRAERSQRSW